MRMRLLVGGAGEMLTGVNTSTTSKQIASPYYYCYYYYIIY
jgi:hypothetical protein